MIESSDKDIKIVTVTIFYMFKNIEERLSKKSTDMKDFSKDQIELFTMKNAMLEIENI